jgi:hypothetical protein
MIDILMDILHNTLHAGPEAYHEALYVNEETVCYVKYKWYLLSPKTFTVLRAYCTL